jgi:hypothetical protein
LGVREMFERLPRSTRDWPILPMNEVLELAVADTGVQDCLDFKLFLAVDDDWWRRILDTAGDIVRVEGLEKRDVEHGMDLHGRGKLEAEGCLANLGGDGERAESLVIELVAGTSRIDVASEKPDLITDLKWRGLFHLAVVEAGLGRSGVDKGARELLVEITERVDEVFSCRVGRVASGRHCCAWDDGMVAVVGEERGVAGRCVDRVVVGKLGAGQKLLPVVLLVVAEGTEILFQDLVDTFSLAITLWMERGRHVWLHVEEGNEVAPEVGGEDLVTVGHDVCWQTVEAVDVAEEETGNVGRDGCGLGRDEMGHLGEAVDHDKDRVVLR